MTCEEIIQDIKNNIETLTVRQVSDYTIKLCIYLGTVGDQLAKATTEYYQEWEKLRVNCDTDGRATNKAKATLPYQRKKYLAVKIKSISELIMALKKREEMLYLENKNTM